MPSLANAGTVLAMLRSTSTLIALISICLPAAAIADNPAPDDIAKGADAVEDKVDDALADGADDASETLAEEVEDASPMQQYDAEGNPIGSSDNPTAIGGGIEPPKASGAIMPLRDPRHKANYPISKVDRPILLPRGMAELRLDVPVVVNPIQASGVLSAFYSVNDNLQLGLRYGLGAYTENGFTAGKSFGLDARYRLTDWGAAQIAIPISADPFAMGITLGVPMQFSFFDTLRLEFGSDLLSIKTVKFVPDVANAANTAALVAANETNNVSARAELHLVLNAFYQLNDHQVVEGRFGTTQFIGLPSGNSQGNPVQLSFGFMHSTSQKLDLGVRTGFNELANAADTFFVSGYAAYRL